SRPHRTMPTRSATRTRPAGMPRRPGGGRSVGSSGRSCFGAVRSWISVVISELEVDEGRDAAGSERRYQEEYDRDRDAQRDRAKARKSRLEPFRGPTWKELCHEPGGDRQEDEGRDEGGWAQARRPVPAEVGDRGL